MGHYIPFNKLDSLLRIREEVLVDVNIKKGLMVDAAISMEDTLEPIRRVRERLNYLNIINANIVKEEEKIAKLEAFRAEEQKKVIAWANDEQDRLEIKAYKLLTEMIKLFSKIEEVQPKSSNDKIRVPIYLRQASKAACIQMNEGFPEMFEPKMFEKV